MAATTQATVAAMASEMPAICSARWLRQPSALQGQRWSRTSSSSHLAKPTPRLCTGRVGSVGMRGSGPFTALGRIWSATVAGWMGMK